MADKQLKQVLFFAHLLALVLYRIFGYSGHFGFDDMEYAELAFQLTQAEVNFGNHFIYRLALILPTSFFYILFGVNDFASSLPSIMASGLILSIVYSWTKKESPAILSMALSMTLFSEWFLFYGNKLMVDIHVCLAIVLIIHLLYKQRLAPKRPPAAYAFLFALSLLYGFLAKGTIILILPLLLFLFIYDYEKKQAAAFWTKSFFFSLLVFAAYFVIILFLSGSAMSRFDAIESNSYFNHCSYAVQEGSVVLKRVFIDFFAMIRNEGFAFSFLFVLAAVIFHRKTNFFKLEKKEGFFLSSSFFLLLSANFMSISLTAYNPMCIDFRHYLWLVPITAVASAKLILQSDHRPLQWTSFGILLLITLSSFLDANKLFFRLYLPMAVIYGSYILLNKDLFRKKLFPILFSVVLLIQPIRISLTARNNDYSGQKRFVTEYLESIDSKTSIMTDKVQARIGNYWLGFDNDQIRFFPFDSLATAVEYASNIQSLINPYTQFFALTNANNYPAYVKQSINTEAIAKNEALNIRFYDSRSSLGPKFTGKLIRSTMHDFESINVDWKQDERQINNKRVHQGKKSYQSYEYSCSYTVALNELDLSGNQNLYLETSCMISLKPNSNALLVVTIDDEIETTFWRGEKIENKGDANWMELNDKLHIPPTKFNEQSRLKIYIWDTTKEGLFIDDFSIELYAY